MRLGLALALATAVCAETCGSTNDEGISGDDIGSAVATSTAACCTACSGFTNSTTNAVCAAAVWVEGQGMCYFKGAGYKTSGASEGSWVVIPGGTPTPPGPTPPGPTPPTPTPPSPTPPAGTPTPWPTGAGTPEPTPAQNAPGGQYAAWSIWPEPADMAWVSNSSAITATLPASFSVSCTTISGACPTPLANAAARYQRTILRFGTPSDSAYLSEGELERASWTAIADRAEFIDVAARRRGVRSDDLELWGEAYDTEFKAWAKVKAATPARWAASHRAGECADELPAAATTAVMARLVVHVNSSADPPLSTEVDESYAMTIGATSAMIEAKTQWGAIRGLETFAQSVYCLPSASAEAAATNGSTAPCIYTLRNLPVTVNDAPRFRWRGVMVDTARHYLGVPSMKRIIDGMSMNKMNMLHWHATDDIAWSIEVILFTVTFRANPSHNMTRSTLHL